jgi:Putative transmembrane protein (PGPGW)
VFGRRGGGRRRYGGAVSGARRAKSGEPAGPPGPADDLADGPADGPAADPARLHPAKRLVLGVTGGGLVLVGVALLVLPGPGLLLVLAGLILFSRAIPAVAHWVEPVRTRAMEAAEASVMSWWRITGSLLAGLGLIAAGVVWGLHPVSWLPLAGWSTGSSLILSGLVLLALLVWSHRRVHGPGAGP